MQYYFSTLYLFASKMNWYDKLIMWKFSHRTSMSASIPRLFILWLQLLWSNDTFDLFLCGREQQGRYQCFETFYPLMGALRLHISVEVKLWLLQMYFIWIRFLHGTKQDVVRYNTMHYWHFSNGRIFCVPRNALAGNSYWATLLICNK